MIVCYDNTVNRQKLADVDCCLDTVSIPKSSQRAIIKAAGLESKGDPLLITCVKARPQMCPDFMFYKLWALVCPMVLFDCCSLTCPCKTSKLKIKIKQETGSTVNSF